MAEGTELSTPVENGTEETSQNAELENSNTSTGEPEGTSTAETETGSADGNEQKEPTLYAGKYKTIDDLVNGYKEAEKFVAKSSELERQIQALNQEKEQAQLKAQQERLEQARLKGFTTPEEQEISEQVLVSELELYANALNMVNPNAYETARQYLQQYAQTGVKAYLDEAKNFFPSSIIESIALQKSMYEKQLKDGYARKMAQMEDTNQAKLAEAIKGEYSEFLADLNENTGKAQALKAFCDCGLIQNTEHMKAFTEVYKAMSDYERAQAIKEYEAKKTIEETKNKASINSDGQAGTDNNSALPTAEAMRNNPKLYRQAVQKWGMERVDKEFMKGQ